MATLLWMTADPVRAVQAACGLLVVPLRLWGLLGNDIANPIYRLYPWWLQVVTLAVYGGIWIMAHRCGDTALRWWTGAAFVVAAAVAAVQGAALFSSGAWVWWLAMATIQGWAYYRLTIRRHDTAGPGAQWI